MRHFAAITLIGSSTLIGCAPDDSGATSPRIELRAQSEGGEGHRTFCGGDRACTLGRRSRSYRAHVDVSAEWLRGLQQVGPGRPIVPLV